MFVVIVPQETERKLLIQNENKNLPEKDFSKKHKINSYCHSNIPVLVGLPRQTLMNLQLLHCVSKDKQSELRGTRDSLPRVLPWKPPMKESMA